MNLSGQAVRCFVEYFKIDIADILVIQDDLDMRVGRVKIGCNSSSGGHNGIKDIERCLGTSEYKRLKVGISKDNSVETKDYVLGKFSKEDKEIFIELFDKLNNGSNLYYFDIANKIKENSNILDAIVLPLPRLNSSIALETISISN